MTIARDEPSPLSKRMHDILSKDLQEIDYDTRAAGPELVLGRSVIRDFANARILDRLMLYERRIENSMLRIMREFKKQQIMRRIEQNSEPEQTIPSATLRTGPIPINDNRDEAATRAEKNSNLKKQSQFSPGLMGVTPFMKGDYVKKPPGGDFENKANQSQFQTHAALKAGRSTRCSSDI